MWLPGLRVVDGLLGAMLTACIGLGLAWITGAVLLQTSNQFSLPSSFRRSLTRSVILRDLEQRAAALGSDPERARPHRPAARHQRPHRERSRAQRRRFSAPRE